MLGKTNAINKFVSGGSGDVVQAVNLTGNLINAGDKVWINQNTQIAGSNFQVKTTNSAAINSYGFVIDPTGTRAWTYNIVYDISSSEATQISTTTNAQVDVVRYGKNGEMFFNNVRCDAGAYYQFSNTSSRYVGDNYKTNPTKIGVDEFDLNTGAVLNTYLSTNTWESKNNYLSMIMRNGKFYYFNTLTNGGGIYEITDNEFVKTNDISGCDKSFYIIGLTSDDKYLIYSTSPIPAQRSGRIYLAEFVDDYTIRTLSDDELPIDLQPYFLDDCTPTFNPNNNVLCIGANGSYMFLQYANNNWTKLNIDIPTSNIYRTLSISQDLSKVGVGNYNGSSGIVYNITAQDGYVLQSYSPTRISANSLTGFANADIANFATGEISTALKAHVSYPEPEPEPGTEQYEINQDTQGGIVFVGDLQTVAGPYGNTVAQITDTTRLTLGNDGANIFAGMFADTQTADCFRIKFKMPRKGISSGGTWYALSDSLSQNVENPTDGCVRFGFTASWDEQNSEIDSQVVSFIMERYSSEQGWETPMRVVMPDFKLNTWYDVMYYYGKYADWEIEENGNSGYCLLINVYNEGGELIGREVYDNYPNGSIVSTENVQIGYPIYATSYFYIDVDLSQTGFQLLDSWVWRPVKEINK